MILTEKYKFLNKSEADAFPQHLKRVVEKESEDAGELRIMLGVK